MTGRSKPKSEKDAGRGFEGELGRLEEIVADLESEDVTLEKALELFEEGTAIVKSARKKLEESRLRVRRILGEEGGDFLLEDFPVDEVDDDSE